MTTIGLDIGTTTICAVVLDTDSASVLHTVTAANDCTAEGGEVYERLQKPSDILAKCMDIMSGLVHDYAPVSCIGVTGQMHGILYINSDGEAVSPLYTWQDESGNQPYKDGKTYAEYLSELTNYPMATGFGCTTYYCHVVSGKLPADAVSICTIHDYIAMKLCGKARPLMHTSTAASIGLFDADTLDFDYDAVRLAGLDKNMLPSVTSGFTLAGDFNGVPVSVGIGDNQASFLGSVSDMDNSILINIGTGSQVSFLTEKFIPDGGAELRPCFNDKFIFAGSSLCGGRAFAMLERFLHGTVELMTGAAEKNVYPAIDRYLGDCTPPENPLCVSAKFAGTRRNPSERGSITNIGTDNFTPQHLIWGILQGISDELMAYYASTGRSHTVMIGSGNGLRKNTALQNLLMQEFRMPLRIPAHSEEAAFGSALFALTAAGIYPTIGAAQTNLIKYKD